MINLQMKGFFSEKRMKSLNDLFKKNTDRQWVTMKRSEKDIRFFNFRQC